MHAQGTGSKRGGGRGPRTACGGETEEQAAWKAEAMLLQKSVESVLFQGRRLAGETNAEKLERFARELAKEHARRRQHAADQLVPPPPPVAEKQQATANPCGGDQLVPVPPPVAVKQQQPAAPKTNVTTATSAAKATAKTEAAAAAAQAPRPRRRRRTPVTTKHGARRIVTL